MSFLGTTVVTHVAFEWFLAGVCPYMVLQQHSADKTFRTIWARVFSAPVTHTSVIVGGFRKIWKN